MSQGDKKYHRRPAGVLRRETTRGERHSHPAVVININTASSGDVTTTDGQHLSGHSCAPQVQAGGYDPHKVHREFPERWQAYIQAHYRNLAQVIKVFEVSESCARKWWTGETGAVGGHVAIAMNEHPVAAFEMLFERAA